MNNERRPQPYLFIKVSVWFLFVLFLWPLLNSGLGSIYNDNQLSLKWYQEIFNDSDLLQALGRSLILGFFSGMISSLLGLISALVLVQSSFQFKKVILFFSVVSLVMPELVFALSLLGLFFILNIPLSLGTVLLAHISFSIAFSTFILTSQLVKMDKQLLEASFDLGASQFQTFLRVTLPLLKSALAASFVICFLLSFDDFIISYFVNGVGSDTLPIRLFTSQRAGHTPKLNALSTLMILFSVFCVFILSKIDFQKIDRD